MVLMQALRGALMFLGVVELIFMIMISAEIAFRLIIEIIREIRDERHARDIWED